MNDLLVECLVDAFKVWNFQGGDRLDRHDDRFICLTVLPHLLSSGPQNPEDLRPVEPLTFTMFAEVHWRSLAGLFA
jgi:hypothetical protein